VEIEGQRLSSPLKHTPLSCMVLKRGYHLKLCVIIMFLAPRFTIQKNQFQNHARLEQKPRSGRSRKFNYRTRLYIFSLRVGTLGGRTQRLAQIYLVQIQECQDQWLDAFYRHTDLTIAFNSIPTFCHEPRNHFDPGQNQAHLISYVALSWLDLTVQVASLEHDHQ
jgi:hypothetical protein